MVERWSVVDRNVAVFDGNVPSSWSVGGRMVVEARQDNVIDHQLSHCITVG